MLWLHKNRGTAKPLPARSRDIKLAEANKEKQTLETKEKDTTEPVYKEIPKPKASKESAVMSLRYIAKKLGSAVGEIANADELCTLVNSVKTFDPKQNYNAKKIKATNQAEYVKAIIDALESNTPAIVVYDFSPQTEIGMRKGQREHGTLVVGYKQTNGAAPQTEFAILGYKGYCMVTADELYASANQLESRYSKEKSDFQLCPDMEVYSIDEAFLLFDGLKHKDLFTYSGEIRTAIKTWTGIPVSIGIGPTKTLAKVANNIAKKKTIEGVFDLTDPIVRENILSQFLIEDIWGIGSRFTKRLHKFDIKTAKDLRDADMKLLRSHFSVVMERIIQELRGISCLPLESIQPRKQIMSSKAFGRPVIELDELEEALSHYAAKACFKMRKQKSLTFGIYVFIHTNYFSEKDPNMVII